MFYNIVSSPLFINEVKRCQFFRKNLGVVSTIDKGINREYNNKDRFAFHYQSAYNTFIYAQGNVGNIKFYIDYFIKEPVISVYFGENFEEFIFDVEFTVIKEKGIDYYLGHILKETDKNYEERAKQDMLKKAEIKKQEGDPNKVIQNPGAVTWADVKAYMDLQNQQRFKKD